ncbi:hypothetical protein SKAU_G00304720 [Synaphobranchus kaupii]|uniref:Uncharacterized protein n=1 Tax=Synaphobranchus kaupii TaxID=118154 RepID=A0A9Q1EWF2_SYNKA|nr:hypothetical protein SKAU_G00304720 [Synaphobranchus kaupii]
MLRGSIAEQDDANNGAGGNGKAALRVSGLQSSSITAALSGEFSFLGSGRTSRTGGSPSATLSSRFECRCGWRRHPDHWTGLKSVLKSGDLNRTRTTALFGHDKLIYLEQLPEHSEGSCSWLCCAAQG